MGCVPFSLPCKGDNTMHDYRPKIFPGYHEYILKSRTEIKTGEVLNDMRRVLVDRGYAGVRFVKSGEQRRYETSTSIVMFEDDENCKGTFWTSYMPEFNHIWAGMVLPMVIPEEKVPFTRGFLNMLNHNSQLLRLSLCGSCRKVDIYGDIFVVNRLNMEKFHTLLCFLNIYAMHHAPSIQKIGDPAFSVEELLSIFCGENPEAKPFLGDSL